MCAWPCLHHPPFARSTGREAPNQTEPLPGAGAPREPPERQAQRSYPHQHPPRPTPLLKTSAKHHHFCHAKPSVCLHRHLAIKTITQKSNATSATSNAPTYRQRARFAKSTPVRVWRGITGLSGRKRALARERREKWKVKLQRSAGWAWVRGSLCGSREVIACTSDLDSPSNNATSATP